MKVTFIHNDHRRTVEADPRDTLRRHITPTGGQEGSCTSGECLRCCVLLAGRVVPACTVPMFRVEGMTIQDAEGLAADALFRDIKKAFEKIGVHRCTEALPALQMLAYQLLSEVPMPTDKELQDYSRHITSRCVSRNEFERATRLAGRVHKRRRHEQSR